MKKLLLFFVIIISTAAKHEYYVSVSELVYSSKNSQLELSVKVFSDDLEKCLKQDGNDKIRLVKGHAETDTILKQYFVKHIFTIVDSEKVRWNYEGHLSDPEETSVYFTCKVESSPKSIQIGLNHMMERFSNQVNILHVVIKDEKKSVYFEDSREIVTLKFK